MKDTEQYIALMPIECPKCGRTVFVLAKDGEQDFKCECGFEDVLTLESAE